jgi:sec-independent protein translocase protein TatA
MNIATFGNFFGPDTLIIFLVILLLFGAKKLPELARGMGQAVREFSKAKDEIEREVTRPPAPPEEPKALYQPKTDVAAETSYHDEHHDTPRTETTDLPPKVLAKEDTTHVS